MAKKKPKKTKWETVPADQVPPKVKEILELKMLQDKVDTIRARLEASVEDLDRAIADLDADDVVAALEAVRPDWQTLEHYAHAEAAASRLTSIAEDLAKARDAVFARVQAAEKEAKKP